MFKLMAISVVVRKHKKYGIQVHTQTRHVINKEYDSLYDNTEEACCEIVESEESIIDAASRACKEELGSPDLKIEKIIGANGQTFSTQPGMDLILGMCPYYFVQQLAGPQPWIGLGFVVVVPSDFEPKLDEKGEVSAHQWWSPKDLSKELQQNPSKFMGPPYPVLTKVCKDIIGNKLTI